MTDVNLLAFIPARSGSVRAPNKNAREIAGMSLIERTVKAALATDAPDAVAFSSDSDAYIKLAREAGLHEFYKRPERLAADDIGTPECVLDYLDWNSDIGGTAFTHIVLLQPTNPFTTADDIDKAVALWRKSKKPSLASVTPAAHNTRFVVSRNRETGKQVREGKNDDRDFYVLDGAIFITPVEMIRGAGRFWDEDSELYVKNYPIFFDIDTEADFRAAKLLLEGSSMVKK